MSYTFLFGIIIIGIIIFFFSSKKTAVWIGAFIYLALGILNLSLAECANGSWSSGIHKIPDILLGGLFLLGGFAMIKTNISNIEQYKSLASIQTISTTVTGMSIIIQAFTLWNYFVELFKNAILNPLYLLTLLFFFHPSVIAFIISMKMLGFKDE